MGASEEQEKPIATIAYATPSVRLFHPLAIVSLILGLLFFLPIIAAVGAIVVGWIARKRIENNPRWKGKGMALTGIILGVISIVGFFVSIPLMLEAKRQERRVMCMSHLHQIAVGTLMYANDNKGALPADPALLNKYLRYPPVWICPECGQPVAGGGSAQQPSSYIYLGTKVGTSMRQIRNPSTVVLAYEPLSNHEGKGFCVLYMDGHVEWISKDRAPAVMQQIQKSIGN